MGINFVSFRGTFPVTEFQTVFGICRHRQANTYRCYWGGPVSVLSVFYISIFDL